MCTRLRGADVRNLLIIELVALLQLILVRQSVVSFVAESLPCDARIGLRYLLASCKLFTLRDLLTWRGSGSGAKRGHFDDLPSEKNMRQPEPPADQTAVAKQLVHFLGEGIGGDVEVLRLHPEQQVANAPADEKGHVPGVAQPV